MKYMDIGCNINCWECTRNCDKKDLMALSVILPDSPELYVSVIYKGDHYQVTVRTEDEEDFVVETEYTYNETDRVSINIAKEEISLSIKGDISKYEI